MMTRRALLSSDRQEKKTEPTIKIIEKQHQKKPRDLRDLQTIQKTLRMKLKKTQNIH